MGILNLDILGAGNIGALVASSLAAVPVKDLQPLVPLTLIF